MISARWLITAVLLIAIVAAGIGFARYSRVHPAVRTVAPSFVRAPSLNPFRCDPEHVVDDATPSEIRAVEAQLYEQIVQSKYQQKVPLVVEDTSIPVPLHTAGPQGAEFFDHLPSELASWVSSRERRIECSEQTIDRFPVGTMLVPEDRIVRNTRAQRAPNVDWARFQELLGAKTLFAFSRARLTSNRLDALMYYDRLCPGQCGEGAYVWLHRDDPSRAWHVVRESVVWSS